MTREAPGRSWQAPDGLHVDTCGLGPPDPMVAIIWHIEQPDQQGPITAYFDRDPIHMLAELAERGWSYDYLMRNPDDVRLVLRRLT